MTCSVPFRLETFYENQFFLNNSRKLSLKMPQYLCKSLCIAFGFIMAAIGIVLGFLVFPQLVNNKINENLKLVNGTDGYERWENLPIPLQFKVYFFNILNPSQVQKGYQPIVQEVGPYVYDQWRHKSDIEENNDTLSYYQNQKFVFNQEASKLLKDTDVITIAHLPLMAIILMTELNFISQLSNLNTLIKDLFYDPRDLFLTTTVRDFLFDGIFINCTGKDFKIKILCKLIQNKNLVHIVPQGDKRLKFSFMGHKNNTHDGPYKIENGVNDIHRLGKILEWNNMSTLSQWKENSTCSEINGTDTTIYPPHQTRYSTIDVFQSDICRSVQLHYNSETKYEGIKGLRFIVEEDMLHNNNSCFCLGNTKGITDENNCLYNGAMELHSCQGVPVVLTFPHFYMADKRYRDTIKGLQPDQALHQMFMDLEPNSGIVLRGSKRVQFNIFYRKVENIDLTNDLNVSLMPVLWIDEGAALDEKYIKLLNDSFFNPIMILDAVYWTLIAVGLAIGLSSLIWCIMFSQKSKHLL